jgi:hypothetical protein
MSRFLLVQTPVRRWRFPPDRAAFIRELLAG